MGSEHSKAIRWARRTFFVVAGKNAPAFTLASFAITMQGMPTTLPMPAMQPAAGTFPHWGYILYAAQRPISKKSLSLSSSWLMRSRAGKRPSLRWRSNPAGPPPSRRSVSSLAMLVEKSRSDVAAAVEVRAMGAKHA